MAAGWAAMFRPAFGPIHLRLLPQQGTDQVVLCIDTDSGLVVEGDAAGEDFFDQDGNISPALKKVVDFLNELERSRKATEVAVSALAEAGVIQPWPIKLKAEQGDRAITGLYRVDEVALNALADDVFLKLRKASALPIAYAQMLSAGQLGIFEHLARLQAQLRPPPAGALPESIDSLFEMPATIQSSFDELIRSGAASCEASVTWKRSGSFRRGAGRKRSSNHRRNDLGGVQQRLWRQVGVALGHADLGMAEEPLDT